MKNKEKFKQILNKVLSFFKKFPVIIALTILIPSLIFTARYILTGDYVYNNLYFNGHYFNVDHEKFQITKIKKLVKVMDISSFGNYQGGTCYENYYVLCSNNFECILIYDLDTMKVEHTIYTNATNTDYHCNTCFFGPNFYSSEDKFPILYISMENAPVHATIGCRIYQRGGTLQIQPIQEILLDYDEETKLYFPNSYYDYENMYLYYGGYTKNSYRQSEDNILRYHVFYLPDYRLAEVRLDPREAFETFELPSETATQGGFISGGHLYQTFSFHKSDDLSNAPKMRVVDLKNHKIIHDYQDLGIYGEYDEFENIALSGDGRLIAHGNYRLNLYEFEYADK